MEIVSRRDFMKSVAVAGAVGMTTATYQVNPVGTGVHLKVTAPVVSETATARSRTAVI